jgi:Peptidase inhibitor family I36
LPIGPLSRTVLGMKRMTKMAVALLAAAACVGVAPSVASACSPGEFCLFHNDNFGGGEFHFSGSDSNLNTNRFVGGSGWVGNNTRSAWNHGKWQSNGINHVLVYTRTNHTGTAGCVLYNQYGVLVYPFAGNVESYKWVNRATCDSKKRAITL